MGEPFVAVAIKPVAPVIEVDWVAGRARIDARHLVRTPADAAACACGLAIGRSLGMDVVVCSVAGPEATAVLAAALAEGASRAVRVVVGEGDPSCAAPEDQWQSEVVAAALAQVAADAAVVVCGDASGDRGSATVPALLAHYLDAPQALGVSSVGVEGTRIAATRRLDRGRVERLVAERPCVVSVEARAMAPVRAPFAAVVRRADVVEVARVAAPRGAVRGDDGATTTGPYRAAPSVIAPPTAAHPARRAIELAGSLVRSDPPELLRCAPDEAAAAILEHLEAWGMR